MQNSKIFSVTIPSKESLLAALRLEPLTALLHWVTERESIRIQKEDLKLPPPWTQDKILGSYRFCNVRREDDKVTKWIDLNIRQRWKDSQHLPTMITIGRFINLPATLEEVNKTPPFASGLNGPDHYDPRLLYDLLENRRAIGQKVYNGAYIISPAGNTDKNRYVAYRCVADVGYGRARDAFWRAYEADPSMAGMYKHLRTLEGFGEFMATQVLADMRWTPLLCDAYDRSTWTAFGPGTRRGLNRLFGRYLSAKVPQVQLQAEAEFVLELIKDNVPLELELEMTDISNIMCETDKYLRGDPKQRYTPR